MAILRCNIAASDLLTHHPSGRVSLGRAKCTPLMSPRTDRCCKIRYLKRPGSVSIHKEMGEGLRAATNDTRGAVCDGTAGEASRRPSLALHLEQEIHVTQIGLANVAASCFFSSTVEREKEKSE